jgi:anthranilate/para-aminobenzoate synthase component II
MFRKKLLLLNCYGQDKDVKIEGYATWLKAGGAAAGAALQIETVDGDAPLAAAGDFAAVVVSGSQKMVGDGEAGAGLLAFLRENRRPLLGICFGHQALAAAFGARVRRDGRKHLGEEDVLVKKPSALFAGLPPVFKMRQSHEEIVVRDAALEKHFLVTALNASGRVEGIAHRDLPLFGVQFHPEKSGELGARLLVNFLKMI